jgi:hypothetical protein
LRKNRQKCGVSPSCELIALDLGWISMIQRLRTPDFSTAGPRGLFDGRRLGTPLGNRLVMPLPAQA